VNLENYDQRYEEALQIITPLVESYPQNPIFRLTQGDMYAKLSRKQLAIAAYREAAAAGLPDEECQKKIDALARASLAAVGAN